MRIETYTRPRIGGGKFYNATLIADDGSVYSTRLFLRDVKTKRAHDKRVADVQKSIDSGYRFPILAHRLAARAEHRTSVVGSL